MRLFVANTDAAWAAFLAREPGLDEANFWRPSGQAGFKALGFGEPLVFKLKKAHGHAIVGFGLFAAFRRMSVAEAWGAFGRANGTATRDEMWARVARYAFGRAAPYDPRHAVGCLLLASPVFFPPEMWVDGPSDWADQTVVGKTYDAATGEGRRIWRDCLDRAALVAPALDVSAGVVVAEPGERYGAATLVRPRLGQQTFRYAVEAAYGQCAVTGEHSRPALDAAHIVPFARDGLHDVCNGILLRADVHRLFDAGYVTVTPDYRFRVGDQLRADFSNGRSYYPLDGQRIALPADPRFRPDPALLERHGAETFLG